MLWCMLIVGSASATVVIEGSAPTYESSSIKFLRCNNYLTKSLEVFTETTVADDGTFRVEFEVDRIHEVWVEINNIRGILYVQPDGYYKIIFPELAEDEVNSMGKTTVTELYFEEMKDADINLLMWDFNDLYDLFFISYDTILGQVRRGVNSSYELWEREPSEDKPKPEKDTTLVKNFDIQYVKAVVDTFSTYLTERYLDVDESDYFQQYVRYVVAEIESSTFAGKNYLYNKYINNNEVLYTNMGYMDFVRDFYEKYLFMEVVGRDGLELTDLINYGTTDSLTAFIARDTMTGSHQLQELIAVQGLYELYYKDDLLLSQQRMLELLTDYATNSELESTRSIASSIISDLLELNPGYAAPDFELISSTGDTVSLSDFTGKWVYIGFWASWCKPCLPELQALAPLYKKYGKHVEFISISLNQSYADMVSTVEGDRGLTWKFLHAGPDSKVARDYNVLSLPNYILVDPEGNISQAPAYTPTPDGRYITIDLTFHEIYWGSK